jgi:hypothetical protein
MLNRQAELDRLLHESLHAAVDGWTPDADRALRELHERRQARNLAARVRFIASAVLRRFTVRSLSALTITAVALTVPLLLAPEILHSGPTREHPRPVPLAGRSAPGVGPSKPATRPGYSPYASIPESDPPGEVAGTRWGYVEPHALPVKPRVTASIRADTRTVPDALWLPEPVARRDLLRRQLRVRLIAVEVRGMVTSDVVVGQYPHADQVVPPDATVTIRVLTGCGACLTRCCASLEYQHVTSATVSTYKRRHLPLPG